MPIMFNTVMWQYGIDPASVRLLRHQDKNTATVRTPYRLWTEDLSAFDLYQSVQSFRNRSRLRGSTWAAFVVDPNGATLFVGFYEAVYLGVGDVDLLRPHRLSSDIAGQYDRYKITRRVEAEDLIGRLRIDWGLSTRAWIQRAERRNKVVVELRTQFAEEEFPGFARFFRSLSELSNLPLSWVNSLKSTKGVYLLTCPKTKEQYVGSAAGADGFWGRWMEYVTSGHGNNLGLKSRDPSDYRVSILETVSNLTSQEDVLILEKNWKSKLQSREMGLNRN